MSMQCILKVNFENESNVVGSCCFRHVKFFDLYRGQKFKISCWEGLIQYVAVQIIGVGESNP